MELKETEVIRARRRVETHTVDVVEMTKENRCRVWFRARVGEVEMSTYLANRDSSVEDELMNEVNWDGNMLDSGGDRICVEDVNAWLTVDVKRHRTYTWSREAKEGCNVLGVDGTLGGSEGATSLAVS